MSIFSPFWHLVCLAISVARALEDVGSVLRMLCQEPGLAGVSSLASEGSAVKMLMTSEA